MTRLDYIDDCKRIQSVLFDNNYSATLSECDKAWRAYSESIGAGWILLPDDFLFELIEKYL